MNATLYAMFIKDYELDSASDLGLILLICGIFPYSKPRNMYILKYFNSTGKKKLSSNNFNA
jgi:hypothetical protein